MTSKQFNPQPYMEINSIKPWELDMAEASELGMCRKSPRYKQHDQSSSQTIAYGLLGYLQTIPEPDSTIADSVDADEFRARRSRVSNFRSGCSAWASPVLIPQLKESRFRMNIPWRNREAGHCSAALGEETLYQLVTAKSTRARGYLANLLASTVFNTTLINLVHANS